MGYYVRVLGKDNPNIHIKILNEALATQNLKARLALDDSEQPNNWTFFEVFGENGDLIAQIERNPIVEGGLGAEELAEFKEIVAEEKPASAAQWLLAYFDQVKVIYAFQLFSAVEEGANFDLIDVLRDVIWKRTGGILQADDEGFTNENGDHILWQFDDEVTGEYEMAVLDPKGQWIPFKMNLDSDEHRRAFFAGKVPKGLSPTGSKKLCNCCISMRKFTALFS